mmetsp:Transcript_12435/g.24757  ORF Transcript_12435/g.24757 Transcript_12435/m.24757 type:complete len:257 (+) Transcript_12435:230-1000(+)
MPPWLCRHRLEHGSAGHQRVRSLRRRHLGAAQQQRLPPLPSQRQCARGLGTRNKLHVQRGVLRGGGRRRVRGMPGGDVVERRRGGVHGVRRLRCLAERERQRGGVRVPRGVLRPQQLAPARVRTVRHVRDERRGGGGRGCVLLCGGLLRPWRRRRLAAQLHGVPPVQQWHAPHGVHRRRHGLLCGYRRVRGGRPLVRARGRCLRQHAGLLHVPLHPRLLRRWLSLLGLHGQLLQPEQEHAAVQLLVQHGLRHRRRQ